MKNKRMKATTLATILALSLSAPVLAAGPAPGSGGGTPPGEDEIKANADTTISIFSTASSQANMSYTVPLYVTMAIANQDAVVKVPTNYGITNTTKNDDAGKQPNIAVTNMSFEKIKADGFNTVAADPADANGILLKIGHETMPALSAKGLQTMVPSGDILVTGGKPTPIGALETNKGYLDLPIQGTVQKTTRTDSATAAQFRLKYTVSLINDKGEALGAVYAGDDHTAAGLPDWHVD